VTTRQRHLVAVWNPTVAADAMEGHIEVLLEMARRLREAGGAADEVYVWWGRVRSPNRQGPLPHLAEVLALDAESPEDEFDPREMHLYLTDYRSLYVGQVGSITSDDMAAAEPDHVPAYYRGLACDCWFQLWDLRRIVHDDTLAVVEELRRLRNMHYNDRPVSIYGGMVDLPLVVYRDDERRFFDAGERRRLLDDRYWVEFDAASTGIGAMERDLRENLLGDAVWLSLDPGSRVFVATAERTFRDHRASAGFDFAPVIGGFAKALELECRRKLSAGLRKAAASARLANVDGRSIDVTSAHLTLGQVAHALAGERALVAALGQGLAHSAWFTGQLPSILDEFVPVRNAGTHAAPVSRETAVRWRNRIMGVGCQGVLAELARVQGK